MRSTLSRRHSTAWVAALLVALALLVAPLAPRADAAPTPEAPRAILYFFWGDGCPHCAAAKPALAELKAKHPELVIRDYEVFTSDANRQLFIDIAAKHGFEPAGVPTFLLGDRHWAGFTPTTTPATLEAAITQCLASGCPDAGAGIAPPLPSSTAPPATTPAAPTAAPSTPAATPSPPAPATAAPVEDAGVLDIPGIGPVNLAGQSLLVSTVLIALVDGFNPCSLWVLTILLALTLRTGSRRLVFLIGAVFILVTGLVYALFMAGIFTALTALSIAPWVRVVVAAVAAVFALVNIKDYFWFKQGVSLSIPDAQKPGLYARMRGLLASTDNIPALIVGTATLAAGVSVIELACTAGFPVLWSNLLTAQGVAFSTFLGLLLVYMVIYQLDELLIFGAAVVTLRASKLEEKHGRILKLVGGMLMLTLAVVMLVDPTLMVGLVSSLVVFGVALAATALVLVVHRVILPRLGVRIGLESSPTPGPSRTRASAASGSAPPRKDSSKRSGRRR